MKTFLSVSFESSLILAGVGRAWTLRHCGIYNGVR